MMRHSNLLAAVAAIATLAGTTASATVIDFNSGSGSFTSYTESGVTFTASGGGNIEYSGTPNGTVGLLGSDTPRDPVRADIAGGATFVSVDLGDYNADADLLYLDIYSALDVLLGHTELLIASSFTGMETLSLSSAGIAYAIFGASAPAINGSSVYADNFTFTSAAGPGVPEPATWMMMLAGFFGLGAALRRARLTYA